MNQPLLLFLAAVCVFQFATAAIIGLDRPFYIDEQTRLKIIKYFSGGPTLEKLRDYEEVNAPGMYVIYAAVGDLVGFDLWKLRLFSILVAIPTCLLYFMLLRRVLDSDKVAALVAAVLIVNPYMIRISVFLFPDMLPLCLMMLSLTLLVRGRTAWHFLPLAATLLFRQYYVFLIVGAIAFHAARAWRDAEHRTDAVRMTIGYFLCMVPFGLLALLWGGIHPPNGVVYVVTDTPEPLYHPHYLTAYLLLIPAYTAPILMFRLKPVYFSRLVLIATCLLTPSYWLAPVALSLRSATRKNPAIGTYHRLLQVIARENDTITHVLLCLTFAAGIPVLLYFVRSTWRRLRRRRFDLALQLDLAILAFLVIMPFSYQLWEKYLIPLIPLVSIRLMLIGRSGNDAPDLPR